MAARRRGAGACQRVSAPTARESAFFGRTRRAEMKSRSSMEARESNRRPRAGAPFFAVRLGRRAATLGRGGAPMEAVRAPRGTALSCKGWVQEAALRMLMNNLDPDVAERPQDLVVYGGTGKAARSWDDYHVIVRELRRLENDQTLLIQSGRAVGVFKTHEEAPRVLISNSMLVPRWATWDEF